MSQVENFIKLFSPSPTKRENRKRPKRLDLRNGVAYWFGEKSIIKLTSGLENLIQVLYSQQFISSPFTNRPRKLECYITLSWKSLQPTNTPAYSAHSQVKKKMKWFEIGHKY